MRQYNYNKINLNERRRKNIQNDGFFNIIITILIIITIIIIYIIIIILKNPSFCIFFLLISFKLICQDNNVDECQCEEEKPKKEEKNKNYTTMLNQIQMINYWTNLRIL